MIKSVSMLCIDSGDIKMNEKHSLNFTNYSSKKKSVDHFNILNDTYHFNILKRFHFHIMFKLDFHLTISLFIGHIYLKLLSVVQYF